MTQCSWPDSPVPHPFGELAEELTGCGFLCTGQEITPWRGLQQWPVFHSQLDSAAQTVPRAGPGSQDCLRGAVRTLCAPSPFLACKAVQLLHAQSIPHSQASFHLHAVARREVSLYLSKNVSVPMEV